MELLQLTYFCEAAETESFTRAAQKYQVPPSDISQCIKRLEKELSVELFDRQANRVRLNDRGRAFYQKAKKALNLLSEAKAELTDQGRTDIIRLSVQTNRRIVMQAVRSFCQLHPEIDIVTSHAPPVDMDDYDIMIADDALRGRGLTREKLLTEDVCLAVSVDNPLARSGMLSAEALRSQAFISMAPGTSMHSVMFDICDKWGFVPRVAIQSDDPFYIRRCVEMDLGVSFVPAVSWKGQFSDAIHLRRIPGAKRDIYAYWDEKKVMSDCVKEFLRMLVGVFQTEGEQS